MLENYTFRYKHNNKYIFKPSLDCVSKGIKLNRYIKRNVKFPEYFFHLKKGGHVAALHQHINNKLFFRLDIKNFYYCIGRNKVASCLHAYGFNRARTYAKWSCVKNPYPGPAYTLPIGFVQSPLLASLALLRSPIINEINSRNNSVFTSIYLDDIVCSSNDFGELNEFYHILSEKMEQSNFPLNHKKVIAPSYEIEAFNCVIRRNHARVKLERIAEFYETPRSLNSTIGFEAYVASISQNNYGP